jgi:ABC-type phosphate/phosphonate transport system substrate-binding protein
VTTFPQSTAKRRTQPITGPIIRGGMAKNEIKLVSLMAENADSFYRELADYLTARTGIKVSAVDQPDWRERERMLDNGQVQMGFICGLQYVRKVDGGSRTLDLLAAPVMQSGRYLGKPIYFSDVVVRCNSPFRSLADLRGCSWACNEPTSHSGCNLIRYHLATLGEGGDFFRVIVESGSHQNSLTLLLDGSIDATAIDSTVLESELRLRPEVRQNIRIIDVLGPSPSPPGVISVKVRPQVRWAIQQSLLMMHREPWGRAILAGVSLARFERVSDSDYDPIRLMDEKARLTPFALTSPEARRNYRRSAVPLPSEW